MNTRELSQLQARIASDILGCVETASMQALEQLLRTRTHPSVHEARHQLHRALQKASDEKRRRWTIAMNTDTVEALHQDVATLVAAYRAGEISTQQYIDMILFLGVFEKGLFDEMMIVLLALESRDRIVARMAHLGGKSEATEEMLWREYQAVQRELWHERREESPVLIREIDPVTVQTTEGSFLLSGRVHLFDSLTSNYTLELDAPRKAERFEVVGSTAIPWHHAQTGILLEMSFPDEAGWHHTPVAVMVWPHQLGSIKERGSAVPARIGARHDFVVHPELFPAYANVEHEALAALRMIPSGLEVRKTHPDMTLTVLA